MTRTTQPPLTARGHLRWAAVAPLLRDLGPKRILELGCGQGGFGARLAAVADYTGVEPDETSWQVARDRITPLGGTVLHGDHRDIADDSGFDLVCAFEVLEHIGEDTATLAEWVPLARPGGHVLLSVPADPERFGASDRMVGHYRRYTEEQLARVMADAGCVDVRLRRYGWPGGYALEAVHNRVSARRLAAAADNPEERSATSGRFMQPRRVAGALLRYGVAPFALVQKLAPTRGPGLVGYGRRPDA
jgi:SAM-dependent methyltransferase